MHEGDLDKLAGMRLQLEVQVNTLESANMNANTLDTMRRGANALRDIHNGLCVHLHTLAFLAILTHNHPCRISVPFPSPSPSPTPRVLSSVSGFWVFQYH